MRKKLFISILLIALIICLFPYRLTARKITHHHFIKFIVTQATIANADISKQRRQLLHLYALFKQHKTLKKFDLLWLQELAKNYKIDNTDFTKNPSWKTLNTRVDIVPISLAIAQAINESAWGTSRFAREGHNYFGQWCYTEGCGLIPEKRAPGQTFEVRKFSSPLASVESYMRNLNTAHLYEGFRDKRSQLRQDNKPLTGLALVSTLTMYSTKRQRYVKLITNIIDHYNLNQYDDKKTH